MSRNVTINNNFKIADAQEGEVKEEELVKDIERFHKIVKEISDPHFWKGYPEFQHHNYLLECVSGECKHELVPEDLKEVLNGNFQKLENAGCGTEQLGKMLKNLHEMTTNLFPKINAFPSSIENFDESFVKEIQKGIVKEIQKGNGKDTIKNAGEFRENCAIPQGEDYEYLKPGLIEEELGKLLHACRQKFLGKQLQLLDAVKFAACFLERFLWIHPFSDGNGRTARLLLNYLLAPFTIVPMTLYTTREGREVYLGYIRQAHREKDMGHNPTRLARFILEAIHKEYKDMGILDYETAI